MKKITFLKSILTAIMLFFITNTFAQGGTTGPLTWSLNQSTGTLTITGNGEMPDYLDEYSPDPLPIPWYEYREFINTVVIGNGVTKIGTHAFKNCYNLSSINIPNGVTSLGGWTFFGCYNLSSVIIPNSVLSIPRSTFRYSGLTSITIPSSITMIGRGAFANCPNLQTVNYNAKQCDPVSGVYDYEETVPVFYESNNFTKLNIGNTVQKIPDYLFYESKKLSSISTLAVEPPVVGISAFYQVPNNIPVSIPCEGVESYHNAIGWGDYFLNIGGAGIQQICMISVNENNHNEIIWKRLDEVVSYKIYREGIQSGQYDLVGQIYSSSPNKWIDLESDAKVRSYRYKVSAMGGSCGTESYSLSDAHKTMHLTINAGMNNSWNLIWTAYEGMEYSTYNIYRSSGESMGELKLIGTMPAGNSSFSDFSAPQGYVYYMVEIMLNETCNVGKAGSSIKSNIATNNPGVGIKEKFVFSSITVYPNPTTGKLQIESYELQVEDITIFDIYGRELLSLKSPVHPETTVDISHLSAGVYFARINTELGELTKKVLKE